MAIQVAVEFELDGPVVARVNSTFMENCGESRRIYQSGGGGGGGARGG